MNFRQGDTTTVLMAFDESISGYDLKVGVYDESDTEVFAAKLSDSPQTIESLGGNVYKVVIPHTTTVLWTGKYYLDVLVKSAGDKSYVNTGEKSIKMNFKAAKIATNLQ